VAVLDQFQGGGEIFFTLNTISTQK